MIQTICKWLVDLFRPERNENGHIIDVPDNVTVTKEKEDKMNGATYKAEDVTVTVGDKECTGPLSLGELQETLKAREASKPVPAPKPPHKVRMNHKFRQCLKSMGWGHTTATHTTPQLHAAMSSLFNTPMRKEIKRAVFRKAFGK